MKLGTVTTLLPAPQGVRPLLWQIDKAAELGLPALGTWLRPEAAKDTTLLNDVAARARARNVELLMGVGGNFTLSGAELDAEIERVATAVAAIARATGIRVCGTGCGPMSLTRWSADPPLADRLERLPQNLGRLADAVAGARVTVAVENHCDYRGHEIAGIVERAGRPNLRVQLDTGNAFAVFEDPVACARVLARHTVSVHIKDIRVVPFAGEPCPGTRALSVPLGEGHVDNEAICALLQQEAPDPAGLALMVETFYLDDATDPLAFLQTSVAWARRHLAQYLA